MHGTARRIVGRIFLLLILGGSFASFFPRRSLAQQVYIDNIFVHRQNANCITTLNTGVPVFWCPPISAAVCTGVAGTCPEPCTFGYSATGFGGGTGCSSLSASTITVINAASMNPDGFGNISNLPFIEFDQPYNEFSGNGQGGDAYSCFASLKPVAQGQPPFLPGTDANNFCNGQVYLCASIGYDFTQCQQSSTTGSSTVQCSSIGSVAVDQLRFDVYALGTNNSTQSSGSSGSTSPGVQVISMQVNNPGTIPSGCSSNDTVLQNYDPSTCTNPIGPLGPVCVLWDGTQNISGGSGKSNGQFTFVATVQTNEMSGVAGNITLSASSPYPNGATYNADYYQVGAGASEVVDGSGALTCPNETTDYSAAGGSCSGVTSGGHALPFGGNAVEQQPITVDVTDVHVIQATSTFVGQITKVPSEPYNIMYRLSRDSTMYLYITDESSGAVVRHLVPGLPRIGEGIPQGTIFNGDPWDGRDDQGDLARPGQYVASFQAISQNFLGMQDVSLTKYYQFSINPLQITDLEIQPLMGSATSLATLSYMLTEPATVYINIYPPGTSFCAASSVNGTSVDGTQNVNDPSLDQNDASVPKDFIPMIGGCTGGSPATLYRSIVQSGPRRTQLVTIWDGTANDGTVLPDGDYTFIMYAYLPSQVEPSATTPQANQYGGWAYNGNSNDGRIWTMTAITGFIPIVRTLPTISQIVPSSTVIGTSPAVTGVNPFYFNYTLSRSCNVDVDILDTDGNIVRTLVSSETRPGNFPITERWIDGMDDQGRVVSSGTYRVRLRAADAYDPTLVSTASAIFPVDMFRITNVQPEPLLTSNTAQMSISYELSQDMQIAWNIYPPGTQVSLYPPASTTPQWPPCGISQNALAGAQPPPFPGCNQITDSSGNPANPIQTIYGMRAKDLNITEFWPGRTTEGLMVPDGDYVFTLTAQSTTTPKYYATDKYFGLIGVQRGYIIFTKYVVTPTIPNLFHTSMTVTIPPYTIDFVTTRVSSVTIQVLTTSIPPVPVRTIVSGFVFPDNTDNTQVWDGLDNDGNYPPNGFYTIQTTAQDPAQSLSSLTSAQYTINYTPLLIYDEAVAPLAQGASQASIDYQISQSMKVAIKIYRPGTEFDAYLNPTPPADVSLVKWIVGVRPPRSEVEDHWDGTDRTISMVPDGNYPFTIVASTDMAAISSLDGSVVDPNDLALNFVRVAYIPVQRQPSTTKQADFVLNSFIDPNPIPPGYPTATFQVYNPVQGIVRIRIYTMSGQMVLDENLGSQAPSFMSQGGPTTNGRIQFVWDKKNQSGHAVAPGVYYALIRLEETLGGQHVLQTVKKFIIQ